LPPFDLITNVIALDCEFQQVYVEALSPTRVYSLAKAQRLYTSIWLAHMSQGGVQIVASTPYWKFGNPSKKSEFSCDYISLSPAYI